MDIFAILQVFDQEVRPSLTKIHLATSNGSDNPLALFQQGDFDEWQKWQTKRNFQRRYVISLIELPQSNKWLFAGIFDSLGVEKKNNLFYFNLRARYTTNTLVGRLIIDFKRTVRQSYLNAENWSEQFLLSSILEKRLEVSEFPGFRNIEITQAELQLIVRRGITSWRAALGNVSGVYLISDTISGNLYVGSASGVGGIWARWVNYAANGHGGNKKLVKLLKNHPDRAQHFLYSVLEIADLDESKQQILARESYWKRILLSRKFGLNDN